MESVEEKREYMQNWEKEHREQRRAYHRNYYATHQQRRNKQRQEYRHRNPEVIAEQAKRYREKYPEKREAHQVGSKIPHWYCCMVCKNTKDLQEHHPDYTKKSFTITLCRSCHQDLHNGKLILEAT